MANVLEVKIGGDREEVIELMKHRTRRFSQDEVAQFA